MLPLFCYTYILYIYIVEYTLHLYICLFFFLYRFSAKCSDVNYPEIKK